MIKWVDPEALDHLIAALKNCRDDVLVSGFYWRFDNGSGEESSFPKKAEIPESPMPAPADRGWTAVRQKQNVPENC